MNRIITLLITLLCLGNVCAQNNKKLVVYQKNGAKVEYKLSEIQKVNIEEIVMVNSISLNTTNKELEKGKTLQLSATVLPTNADKRTVSWSSSNKSVATVSSSGLVTAKGAGTATITATAADGSGVSSSATITVPTPSLLPAFTIPSGVTVNISNTEEYPWDINNNILSPTNFDIDGSNSYFTVTITSENPIILSFDWKVSSEREYDFLYYSVDNGTETEISGSTSYERKTLSLSSGTHNITFGYRKDESSYDYDDIGWIKNIVITIPVSSITLNSTYIELNPSATYQLSASIYPENATYKGYNWSTSNSNVATVSSTGLVTAKSTGTATITATAADGSGVKTSTTITVLYKNNGHGYVDLGLPSGIKWATCNVGADSPEEYGDYFAWGETTPYYTVGHSQDSPCTNWRTGKTGYNWASYKWCRGSSTTMTRYCTGAGYGTVDNKITLELSDDAARANWGGTWRMPTRTELNELRTNCTWTWTTQNGVKGYKVTSKTNGNSIFIPAAGHRAGTSLSGRGTGGDYWSSSLYSNGSNYASELYFGSSSVSSGSDERSYGFSVRGVCP